MVGENKGKPQSKVDDDWGQPYDLGNPHFDGRFRWQLDRIGTHGLWRFMDVYGGQELVFLWGL